MNLKINIHEPWHIVVMYLPPGSFPTPGGPEKRHIDLAKVEPTEKFFEMVREEVRSFLVEGKEPLAEIAPAIMNISDDLKSGRDPVIRAGDYITLMGYARSNKIV